MIHLIMTFSQDLPSHKFSSYLHLWDGFSLSYNLSLSLSTVKTPDNDTGFAIAMSSFINELLNPSIKYSARCTCTSWLSRCSASWYAIRANFIILLVGSARVSPLFCFLLIRALATSVEFANFLYMTDNRSNISVLETSVWSSKLSTPMWFRKKNRWPSWLALVLLVVDPFLFCLKCCQP